MLSRVSAPTFAPFPANRRGSSLKHHLGVLGILALATLTMAATFGWLILRQTESSQGADAEHLLDRAAEQLAVRYAHLKTSFDERHTGLVLRPENEQILRSVTEATLAGMSGVEGGFYSAEADRLLGYAYPTYPGSGPKTDIPVAESATIRRVASTATAVNGRGAERVVAGADLILFRAQSLPGQEQPVGAAWVMLRLNGVHSPYQYLSLIGLLGLLMVSVTVATGAWFLTRRIDRGVAELEAGLRMMEADPALPLPLSGILELDRIGSGITRLTAAFLNNQARQAELERRLRQTDRLAALGRLVAGVAHELRNPLASVKLKLQLTRRSLDHPDQILTSFDVIEEEVGKMNRLVERLLSLARPSHPSPSKSDPSHFVKERLVLWENRATSQGTILEFCSAAPASEPIHMDRDRVGQIVDNLIANALDALVGEGGRMTIEVERIAPNEILIAVSDNGPGVPEEKIERIFEPFCTTRREGTGLGLFLSAEMARGLGGTLDYCRRADRGARFELRFPC